MAKGYLKAFSRQVRQYTCPIAHIMQCITLTKLLQWGIIPFSAPLWKNLRSNSIKTIIKNLDIPWDWKLFLTVSNKYLSDWLHLCWLILFFATITLVIFYRFLYQTRKKAVSPNINTNSKCFKDNEVKGTIALLKICIISLVMQKSKRIL